MQHSDRIRFQVGPHHEGSGALARQQFPRQYEAHQPKRPEDAIREILENRRASHFATRHIVAEATNFFFRTRERREMGFRSEDFDSARVVLSTHPLAKILYGEKRPRLSLHFQSFDQYLGVSRRLGRNHQSISSIALTLSLPTDLLDTTRTTEPWLRAILVCEAPLGYHGLLTEVEQRQIFAHEMGHALDPKKEASLITPKSRLLRELVAMAGERLSETNLRATSPSLATWEGYARIVLDEESKTGNAITFSYAERLFLRIHPGPNGMIGYEELVEQMASGMDVLSERILDRFTAVEAIRLLHECADFEELAEKLPVWEAKRMFLQERGDARTDVADFLATLGIRFAMDADNAVAKYLFTVVNTCLDVFYAFRRNFEFHSRSVTITLPENLAQDALAVLLPPAWYFGADRAAKLGFPPFWDRDTQRRLEQLQLVIFYQLLKRGDGKTAHLSFTDFQGADVQRIELPDGQVRMTVRW